MEKDRSTPESIYNWARLDDRVTTSGQPSEVQLAALRDIGVQRIINLGLHSHERALPDEAASAAALGIDYVYLPVDFKHPTQADFDAFRAAFEADPQARVHVHCIANYRVSAFFYRYRRDVLHWDEARARAAMEAIWTPDAVWADFIA